jgi:hypothetical protein
MKSNAIVTSTYTKLNWLPVSLFKQFKKPVIIYFFIVTVVTFLDFSPKKPASMMFTFLAVVLFSMFRELFDDLKR